MNAPRPYICLGCGYWAVYDCERHPGAREVYDIVRVWWWP